FSARRSLDALTRWAIEAATNTDDGLSVECRLFLIDRLLRGVASVVTGCSPSIEARLPVVAVEMRMCDRLAIVVAWLDELIAPTFKAYSHGVRTQVKQLLRALNNGASR